MALTIVVYDYLWNLAIEVYRGEYYSPATSKILLYTSLSARTGAFSYLAVDGTDLFKLIKQYPGIVYNKTRLNLLLEPHVFNNSREAYGFYHFIMYVLNISTSIYGDNWTFYFNITYPSMITSFFQAIDGKPIINTGPETFTIGLYDSIAIYYKKDLKTGRLTLSAIFDSLAPLKYMKIEKYRGSVNVKSLIEKGKEYIRSKYNLPSYIPILVQGTERVFYLVSPWTLREFVLVNCQFSAGSETGVILLIDPFTGEVYDEAVLPGSMD